MSLVIDLTPNFCNQVSKHAPEIVLILRMHLDEIRWYDLFQPKYKYQHSVSTVTNPSKTVTVSANHSNGPFCPFFSNRFLYNNVCGLFCSNGAPIFWNDKGDTNLLSTLILIP